MDIFNFISTYYIKNKIIKFQNLIKTEHYVITGQYIRSGTSGLNNPTIINLGFHPKIFQLMLTTPEDITDGADIYRYLTELKSTSDGYGGNASSLFLTDFTPSTYYFYFYYNKSTLQYSARYLKINLTDSGVELRLAQRSNKLSLRDELDYQNATMQFNIQNSKYYYFAIS